MFSRASMIKPAPEGDVVNSSDGDSEVQVAPSIVSTPGSVSPDSAPDSDPAFVPPAGSKRGAAAMEDLDYVASGSHSHHATSATVRPPVSSIAAAAKRRRQQLTQSMSAAEVLYGISCGGSH